MAGHDHHFLSRLDRVCDEHVELALSLYRDSVLLQLVLSSCHLEERHERVAIAMGPADRGPYIIVARDGGFVTCLGEGMSPGDWPIISRAKLDAIAKNVSHLHQKVEFARRVGLSKSSMTLKLRDQLMLEGGDLCREDFQAALALQPLLAAHYYDWMVDAETTAAELRERLYNVHRNTPAVEESLHRLFQLSFSTANLGMLTAWDPRPLLHALGPGRQGSVFGVPWTAINHGVAAAMFRGLWSAARLGKPLLAEAKRLQSDYHGDVSIWTFTGSIGAVGLRHSKLRAEARKSLFPAWLNEPPASAAHKYRNALLGMLAGIFRPALERPEALTQGSERMARQLTYDVFSRSGPAPWASPEALPPDVVIEAIAFNHIPFLRADPNVIINLALLVPWAITVEAEAFFCPRSERRMRGYQWLPEHTLELLAAYRHLMPRLPRRAAVDVGPNAPCPCSSGKKYKKCCGRPGAKVE